MDEWVKHRTTGPPQRRPSLSLVLSHFGQVNITNRYYFKFRGKIMVLVTISL